MSSPWTYHPCSSPSHLQLPEEVLQLLPLDVAITWETHRTKCHVIATYHKGVCQYRWHAKTPLAQMWSQCHSVKQITAWMSFASIDSNMSLLLVTLFLPLWLNRLDYWLIWCKLITPLRLCVHRVVCKEKLYIENCFPRILKEINTAFTGEFGKWDESIRITLDYDK